MWEYVIQLKFLIGNHPTLSLILAGIYISSLDGECKVKAVEENRQRVYDKYGSKGVPILNLGTTGFIQGYIKWLSNYNLKHNPSRSELIDIYEGILEDWKERTIFVQGCMTSRNLAGMITSKINIGKDVFFIFASKSAIKIAEESIKQIKDNGIIKESNYELLMDKLNNQEDERVWIFEKKEIKIISQ